MKAKLKIFGVIVVVVLILSALIQSITIVDTGEAGVRVRLGQVVGESLPAGLYLNIPFIDSIKIFNVKVQK